MKRSSVLKRRIVKMTTNKRNDEWHSTNQIKIEFNSQKNEEYQNHLKISTLTNHLPASRIAMVDTPKYLPQPVPKSLQEPW